MFDLSEASADVLGMVILCVLSFPYIVSIGVVISDLWCSSKRE